MKTKDTQELTKYEKELSSLEVSANEYSIVTVDDLDRGAELLSHIKHLSAKVTEEKKKRTKPLMEQLSWIRDLFRPFQTATGNAEKTVKDKLLAFQAQEDERIEKEKNRIEKRVEKGTMRPDTAIEKLDAVGSTKTSVDGKFKTQVRRVLEITDESLLSREYLIPDREKITKALFAGLEVSGAILKEQKTISASRS